MVYLMECPHAPLTLSIFRGSEPPGWGCVELPVRWHYPNPKILVQSKITIYQTLPRTQGKQATASQQARRPFFLFFSQCPAGWARDPHRSLADDGRIPFRVAQLGYAARESGL